MSDQAPPSSKPPEGVRPAPDSKIPETIESELGRTDDDRFSPEVPAEPAPKPTPEPPPEPTPTEPSPTDELKEKAALFDIIRNDETLWPSIEKYYRQGDDTPAPSESASLPEGALGDEIKTLRSENAEIRKQMGEVIAYMAAQEFKAKVPDYDAAAPRMSEILKAAASEGRNLSLDDAYAHYKLEESRKASAQPEPRQVPSAEGRDTPSAPPRSSGKASLEDLHKEIMATKRSDDAFEKAFKYHSQNMEG